MGRRRKGSPPERLDESEITPIEVLVTDQFGLDPHDVNCDTIAEFILGKLECIAKAGNVSEADGIRLKVDVLVRLGIARVSLLRNEGRKADGGGRKGERSSVAL